MRKFILAVFAVILLAAVIEATKSKEYVRRESKDAMEDAVRFLSEQIHLDRDQRKDLMKKYLKHEISFEELVNEIDAAPSKYPLDLDEKRKMQIQSIKEKLANIKDSKYAREGL
ncbi:unnamed protein product [Chironomus riparius]|uniref:DUF1104 domain-containing protein n=1 Tax=Chironomus riparius TaxID=315576 RepID=A0A9N9S6U5_9DIPT|nr:unnamed protein product [Chironomus riparius]